MATDDKDAIALQQVVFIDSDVPDIQDLIAGLAPGTRAFVLDPSSDGVQQIANILAADDLMDLSSISIVGHGAAGEIQLGSSILDTGDLSSESAALAQIGAALAPGGDLQLYACDVASGATGQQFIADLSQYVGGAAIAASSNLVGAAAQGGRWTLDADSGAAHVASPFTAAAEAAYSGELSLTGNQIVFGVSNANGTALGSRIEQFGVSGSSASGLTDIIDGSQVAGPVLNDISGVAVDTALNAYFVAGYNYLTYEWTIQRGSITGGGGLSTFYTDPLPALNSNNAPDGGPITGAAVLLGGLALDAQNGELYYTQSAENYQSGDYVYADTGIYEVSVSGGAPTQLTPTNGVVFNPDYIALDAPANLLFFTDSIEADDGFAAVDNLDAVNLTTGAVTVLKSFFGAGDTDDLLQGLAVSGNKIYVTTRDFDDHLANFGADSANNQILSIPFSVSGSGSTATASAGAATTLYSGAGADQPTNIVVDAANSIFYTTGSNPYTVNGNLGDTATIFEGSLSGGASLTPVLSMQTVTGPITSTSSPAFDTFAPQLLLLTQPIVTASGTVTAASRGPAVTVDAGAIVSDEDGQNLAGATVSGALTDDTLSFNGGNPKTFGDGDKISSSFSGGVLTLSGNATVADYQTALDSVTFATTSSDVTPRTIDWTVTDGVVTSATASSTVDVTACYGRGTRILTERGEVVVEHLAVGDMVVTSSGAKAPIRWIGHRTLDCARHPRPKDVWPIQVVAGAFGDNQPSRDLWLSPGHNIAADSVLIPICVLQNGKTVVQRKLATVEYWHVELDEHDIILAEGLPAESYLDTGNRTAFVNGGAFIEAHPDFKPRHWADTCAPLAREGPEVARVKRALLERLEGFGHVITSDADLHVIADGKRFDPMEFGAMRFAFALPAGCADIQLISRTFIPAHTRAESADTRSLGVCVRRLQIDCEDIVLDGETFRAADWHEREPGQRWTRGNVALPPKTRLIVINLAGAGDYWQERNNNVLVALFA